MSTKTFAALLVTLVGLPAVAHAQRQSPLADAPAVRNRVEMRAKRAELGAGLGSSINRDFYHAVMFNVRGAFHFNDWIGIGANVGLNITPTLKTGFHERLTEVLPSTGGAMKEPTQADAEKSMNKVGETIALQLEATPFSGKYSMFGKLFFDYDFYGFVGPGFVHLKSDETNPCNGMGRSCKVDGFKPGANVGIGMHTYINQFVGLNVELRDLIIKDNAAGRDVDGDRDVDDDDLGWSQNLFVGLNLVLMLPTSAPIAP